jgi:hypothetical protein
MKQLNIPLAEHIRDDGRSLQPKVHELSMHTDADMNISLF